MKTLFVICTLLLSQTAMADFVQFKFDSYDELKQSVLYLKQSYTIYDDGSVMRNGDDPDSTPSTFTSTNNGECVLDAVGGRVAGNTTETMYGFVCESGVAVYKMAPHSTVRACDIYFDSTKYEYVFTSPTCGNIPTKYTTRMEEFQQKPTLSAGEISAADVHKLDQQIMYIESENQLRKSIILAKKAAYKKRWIEYIAVMVGALTLVFTLYEFYIKRQIARNKFKATVRETYAKVSAKMVEYARNGIDCRYGSPIAVYDSYFLECAQQMQDSGLFSDTEITTQKHEFNDYMVKNILK